MGDTRRVVDGEDSATVRPLRPATPPAEPSGGAPRGGLPRPRRPWLSSEQPGETHDTPADASPDTAGATDTGEETKPDAAGAADAGEEAKPDAEGAKADAPEDPRAAGRVRRHRAPFAHAVRTRPRRAVAAAARATRAWARRPSGRLTLSGLFLLALVGATAAAGALVVPATAPKARPAASGAGTSTPATGTAIPPGEMPPGVSGTALPPGTPATPSGLPAPTGRPADALAAWAQEIGAKVGISPVAMQAYGYAELVVAQTTRSCQLSWTTLAAIGYVESRHGQADGATLGADGQALPEIIGAPLDGKGGRSLIRDTDRGLYDRDTEYDRAIGPMQFIPTTWQEVGADADNDGRKNPHDLDDAALAAANYLCKGGRNMTIPGDWWGAVLSYNDVRRYAQDVFDKANEYGVASRR
jgi:membrane-bound lytic murein transglycosylase B